MGELIRTLRGSGYTGYDEGDNNSQAIVDQLFHERYAAVYGTAAFHHRCCRCSIGVQANETDLKCAEEKRNAS